MQMALCVGRQIRQITTSRNFEHVTMSIQSMPCLFGRFYIGIYSLTTCYLVCELCRV